MSAMTEERPIFENEEWLLSEGGLEHKTTGYFIDRESLGQRREDGLWSWPLHMAEKSWCGMQPFSEAFTCALSVFGIGTTGVELAQSLKVARCEVSVWPKAARTVSGSVPAVPRPLHQTGTSPILVKPRSAPKPMNGQGFQSPSGAWRIRTELGARLVLKNPRQRSERLNPAREASLSWQAPRRIRKTGTKLVRLLQAAWNIR
ncbi:hypothetical protein [Microvirga terrestris]|uniref:Uncharacterized protein n=1 Tax=Microvirga terrestris TaxID=2791024 RepID=A0ABS0HQL5_9HYPH|nr:hypothetical protein [Microvirga terrestris]MBF9195775.1 hypothetical protein [Microvirga terrestris]